MQELRSVFGALSISLNASSALRLESGVRDGFDKLSRCLVVGGALIGSLSGGNVFVTIGGAVGAGLASKMAGSLSGVVRMTAQCHRTKLKTRLAAWNRRTVFDAATCAH